VTGSRLRRSPFNSPDPLTIIDPELESKGGEVDTGEILQTSAVAAGSSQITSLVSAGSFTNAGGVGAQTLSLRGLGATRTLVLVNGRRAGPAGTRGQVSGFDLNVIPSSLIQSVEILKTGASSIYGSDAIAGVVNLKTKRATDGFEIRGFLSQPFESGREVYQTNAAYGREFGRGHIIGGVDYYKAEPLKRGDRDYLYCPEEYLLSPEGARRDIIDPRTGRPRCNEFAIGNYIFTGNRALGIGGLTYNVIGYGDAANRYADFVGAPPNTATAAFPAGLFALNYTCPATSTPEQFQLCRNSVALVPQESPFLRGVDVLPSLTRYTGWLDASYEITDNIELVGEFLFNRRETETNNYRSLFFDQFTAGPLGASGNQVPVICGSVARQFTNPNCKPTGTGDALNAGFLGSYLVNVNVEIPTYVATKVDYSRGVVGVKANINSNWRLDSYVQYSKNDGDYTNSRVFQDAVELLEYRSVQCAPGQLTRIRKAPCVNIDFTDPRVLSGNFNAEESAFLFGRETGNTKYDQLVAEASVAGNLFRMPAGNIGVALGVQWRRDKIDDVPGSIAYSPNPLYDPSVKLGDPRCTYGQFAVCNEFVANVWGQSVSGRTRGTQTSREAFGEIEVPLIHNTPFIKALTLSGAARVTTIKSVRAPDGLSDMDKNNWTYKLGANWRVNDWLAFRGTVGTSFRSPALFEQFLANQVGFQGQAAIDPCVNYTTKFNNGTLSQLVRDRCAGLGLPADYNGLAASATIFTGGGIGVLDPETSFAKTFSVLFTPQTGFWDGMRFSLAVDYFDIDVKNQVTTLGAGSIVSGCLNSDDFPADPLCGLFTRQLNPALPEFGAVQQVSNPYLNINRQRNRGLDLTARITQDLGRYGKLSMIGQGTFQIEDLYELFAGFVSDSNGEDGDPKFVGNLRTTWDIGPWSIFHGLDFTGATNSEQDLVTARGATCINSATRGGLICPIYKFDEQFIHSASVTREFGDRFSLTAGVNNIFDTPPPRISGSFSSIGSSIGQVPIFSNYDLIGRRAFISGRAKF
jgi:iron complex outermembrane receptor protein